MERMYRMKIFCCEAVFHIMKTIRFIKKAIHEVKLVFQDKFGITEINL